MALANQDLDVAATQVWGSVGTDVWGAEAWDAGAPLYARRRLVQALVCPRHPHFVLWLVHLACTVTLPPLLCRMWRRPTT